MLGYGIAIGMAVGMPLGALCGVLIARWGMGIHEAIVLGVHNDEPVFAGVDSYYEKSQTDQEDDDQE